MPIEPTTASNWAHETVAEAIAGLQLKRVRSGVETLLAAHDINREVRGHLQSHGEAIARSNHGTRAKSARNDSVVTTR